MKINTKKVNAKALCDIKTGEVFKYNGEFYMKIEDIIDFESCLRIKAVDLSNWLTILFLR